MLIEYGIVCQLTDEKTIVKNVNSFLTTECGFRKMYKWPDRSIKPKNKPFDIDHYYCQFLKEEPGWYFDITPNYDKQGRMRFHEYPECAWTVWTKPFYFAKPVFGEYHSNQTIQASHIFLKSLLDSIGFPIIKLHHYTDNEDRI